MFIDNPYIQDGTADTQSQSDGSTKAATTAYVDTAAAARGDVDGPGSSTDNAIARFDGTGGKTLQNSGIIIDDSDSVTGAADITCEGINHDWALYRDVKSTSTNGGSSSATTWQVRTLNTADEKDDSGSFSTLSSNQFTLQAGRYYLRGFSRSQEADRHLVRIDNATDTTTELTGAGAFSDSASNVDTLSLVEGEIDIASAKAFELVHYTQSGRGTSGLGVAVGASGYSEIYTHVYIKRLGP